MPTSLTMPPFDRAISEAIHPEHVGVDTPVGARSAAWGALVETTKPGITRLVAMTSAVGFAAGAMNGSGWTTGQLAVTGGACIIGTALAAGGANALNEWLESARDAKMTRTSGRPIPDHRLGRRTVLLWGVGLGTSGTGLLWALCGMVPALLALASILLYVFVYTPLKPVTVWNTLIGAIPGALPPMIGAAAASHATGFAPAIDGLGLSLFVLMVLWQVPHFLAIAWKYRDDYALGGFRMLPIIDPTGKATGIVSLLFAVALLPATLAPMVAAPDLLGPVYAIVATLISVGFIYLAARFAIDRTLRTARALFFGSIAHLPLLMMALVFEGALRTFL